MNKNSWYLASNNTWLYNKEAFDYISDKLNRLIMLKEEISKSIKEINELIDDKEDTTNIYNQYLDIGEKISLIEIKLEILVENIRSYKNDD